MLAFDHLGIADELDRHAGVFASLLVDKSQAAQQWRPAPDKWSLLEIVCHLLDEEREDFRARTRFALETPGGSPPSIDPPAWVKERDYASRDYETVLKEFLAERKRSVAWLRRLKLPDANWDLALTHGQLGKMTARRLLSNWLAHDYLHIRQINRYGREYFRQTSEEDLGYAGDW